MCNYNVMHGFHQFQYGSAMDMNRIQRQWKHGDYCMAKYWEDHKVRILFSFPWNFGKSKV